MQVNSTIRTAVIYARFSCSKQREASIADQLRVCREWCEREGYTVVREYADRAMSGRTDDRPEFQQMIARAGESDIVLVYMMDRFSRDAYDAPIYKRELAKHGVQLVSALEAIPDSPEGIIYEKLLEGLAACESRKTAVRVKRGMEGNALQCKANGVVVWGYKVGPDGRYVIDEELAPAVREAFKRRANREPAESIARDFAARGYLTTTGKPYNSGAMHTMLHNEKYTGVYKWGDVRVEGGMPAIIDKATFDAVQTTRPKKDQAREDWGTYALSGKICCAECGRELSGTSGHGRHGVKYEYYRCRTCGGKTVRRDLVEGAIAAELRRMLGDRGECMEIAKAVAKWAEGGEIEEMRKAAERSKRDAEKGLANILRAIEQGIIPPGAKERIEELEAQRDIGTGLSTLVKPNGLKQLRILFNSSARAFRGGLAGAHGPHMAFDNLERALYVKALVCDELGVERNGPMLDRQHPARERGFLVRERLHHVGESAAGDKLLNTLARRLILHADTVQGR